MGALIAFPQPEGRRPRLSARALGLNARALGINPRALAQLTADELAERLHTAAELARTRAAGQLAAIPSRRIERSASAMPAPRGRTLRRPLAIAGCGCCGGTGWAEAAGGVTECECRDGLIM